MITFLYIIGGLALLVFGGELLVRSSVGLSLKLNISRIIIGLTVVSFATSAPELIVSVKAAMSGSPGLSLGNVIGSNIANIGLVLGLTAIISPMAIDKDFFKFNWPWMIAFTVVLMGLLYMDKDLNRAEGIGLLVLLMFFLVLLIRRARKAKSKKEDAIEEGQKSTWPKILILLFVGGGALWLGSEWLVEGAVTIATDWGVPESIIGISMVALGTSVPELAASIMAALRNEKAISLGNLIGSNIFNIGSVLGITAAIHPIDIPAETTNILNNDIFWMLGFALVLLPLAYIPTRQLINRWKGALMCLSYILFIFLLYKSL